MAGILGAGRTRQCRQEGDAAQDGSESERFPQFFAAIFGIASGSSKFSDQVQAIIS
jgi:hypothetical protein